MDKVDLYIPPLITHGGDFQCRASVRTVCKAVNKADDIPEINERSKLKLVREPTNAYDPCAIRVCCEDKSNVELQLQLHTTGYLSAKACKYVAPLMDKYSDVVEIDCIMMGKVPGGLSADNP